MSEEHLIKVERSARFHTHGEFSEATKVVWIVAHGYAQLSEYFIKHFEHLDKKQHFVIAPEGLSKAYINGMSGRVGASWMTKSMREQEIDDYVKLIETIVSIYLTKENSSKIKVVALGFSQGAATISRWVHRSEFKLDTMILWAGQPAKELIFENSFNKLPIIFVLGNNDPYISGEFEMRLKEQFEQCNWFFKSISFEGEHHLDKVIISTLGNNFVQ